MSANLLRAVATLDECCEAARREIEYTDQLAADPRSRRAALDLDRCCEARGRLTRRTLRDQGVGPPARIARSRICKMAESRPSGCGGRLPCSTCSPNWCCSHLCYAGSLDRPGYRRRWSRAERRRSPWGTKRARTERAELPVSPKPTPPGSLLGGGASRDRRSRGGPSTRILRTSASPGVRWSATQFPTWGQDGSRFP